MLLVWNECGHCQRHRSHEKRIEHERWDVKSLTDTGACIIDTNATGTSVHAQCKPNGPPKHIKSLARQPDECQVYILSCRIIEARLEPDGDYHLIILDLAAKDTMVAEIPDPSCCQPSRWVRRFAKARDTIDSLFAGKITRKPKRLNPALRITIEGVGFWDSPHHCAYHAKNWREIHPVLEVRLHE
jgi:hypothetical protein